MASRAVQLCFKNARPTYNDSIILDCEIALMEGGSVFVEVLEVTVGISDTIVQVQNAIAVAVRARAVARGMSAIAVNNVTLTGLVKG